MVERRNKWLSLFLVFSMVIALLPTGSLTAYAASLTESDYSTAWYIEHKSAPYYEISTAAELAGLSYLVSQGKSFWGKTITLTNDIDLSDYTNAWMPIGDPSHFFNGKFDGAGKKITGFSINVQEAYEHIGLFGFIETNAIIKNLNMENVNIKSGISTGSLVGENKGTIINCHVTGKVASEIGRACVGGLVGKSYGKIINCNAIVNVGNGEFTGNLVGLNYGTITNCNAQGTVWGNVNVGGLVGENLIGHIDNCYASTAVEGLIFLGGFVGWNNGVITNSYATGTVTGDHIINREIGGFVGVNSFSVGSQTKQYTSIIINCYATGSVTTGGYSYFGNYSLLGGFAGKNQSSIINCYATGMVAQDKGDTITGGFTGLNYFGNLTNCYTASTVSGHKNVCGFTGLSRGGSVINCYYNNENLDDIKVGKEKVLITNLIGMSTEEMKESLFVNTLNANTGSISGTVAWLSDTNSVNGGYPILDCPIYTY